MNVSNYIVLLLGLELFRPLFQDIINDIIANKMNMNIVYKINFKNVELLITDLLLVFGNFLCTNYLYTNNLTKPIIDYTKGIL